MGVLPFEDIVRLRKNEEVSTIYDVGIEAPERLRAYSQVECHTVLYPYSRQVSAQDIAFYPFEEYVRDVLSHQRSAYAAIERQFNELFGLLLGAAIALVFARFKPDELLSIESIVSVFGAYVIGKELWDDIEQVLVNVSKRWRLRYQEGYYRYRLEKHTTLTSYSYLGKRRRYGKAAWLPEQVDFIKQSNSQTLRMCFDTRDRGMPTGPSAHIHSIHVDPEQLGALEAEGFLFGVKLSLNRRVLGVTRSLELFQSIDGGARGCLDGRGVWVAGAAFYRRTYSVGRIKYYHSSGIVKDARIVNYDNLAKVTSERLRSPPSQG